MNVMSCMKCGREIALGQAFCKDCLEDMSHYPVNPATPVHIPVQPPSVHTGRRTRTRKKKNPEEQILRLRKQVRLQAIVILCLLTMLIVLGIYGFRKLYITPQPVRPGENYLTTEIVQQEGPVVP